jgi:hypothetical protein
VRHAERTARARRLTRVKLTFIFHQVAFVHGAERKRKRMMLPNYSPEPTAVGACRSAIAVHATSRRWLSFFRCAALRA